MPGFFLDTSAVAKRYHPETGSKALGSIVDSTDNTLYISRLAVVEVESVLAGKIRSRQLTEQDVDLVQNRFRSELRRRVFRTVVMKAGHFREAERLIRFFGRSARLRTLDAVQLAVAVDLHKRNLVEFFVCADKALCQVAEQSGMQVINPEEVDRTAAESETMNE